MPDDPLEDVPDIAADLAHEEQRLDVRVEHRTFEKPIVVVEGVDPSAVDVDHVADELGSAVGAPASVEDDTIEIQGDVADRVRAVLDGMGFRTV